MKLWVEVTHEHEQSTKFHRIELLIIMVALLRIRVHRRDFKEIEDLFRFTLSRKARKGDHVARFSESFELRYFLSNTEPVSFILIFNTKVIRYIRVRLLSFRSKNNRAQTIHLNYSRYTVKMVEINVILKKV